VLINLALTWRKQLRNNGHDQVLFEPWIFLNLKLVIMAKQKGIIKLKGTIGDITFFKSKDGYIAREKSAPSPERVANDPAFQRTRENGAEFGRAGKAGKTLRNAIRPLLQNAADGKVVSRLTKEMMKVVKSDEINERGLRNVIDGETELLEGFDFNIHAKLGTTFYVPYTATIDRISGKLTLNVPSFQPATMIVAPAGTTHFKIVSAGSEIDFEKERNVTEFKESAILVWDNNATAVMNVDHSVSANSTHPLFVLLGIQFFQQVNGVQYSLKNGAFNALAIVKVSGV
jgi:hypothetical protein